MMAEVDAAEEMYDPGTSEAAPTAEQAKHLYALVLEEINPSFISRRHVIPSVGKVITDKKTTREAIRTAAHADACYQQALAQVQYKVASFTYVTVT